MPKLIAMTGCDANQETEIRDLLLAQKAELEALMGSAEEAGAPVELDQTVQGRLSRMDAMQQQAMAAEMSRQRQVQLRRIEAALQRLEAGEYGYCVTCGEDIEAKRLALDPATPTCLSHAR